MVSSGNRTTADPHSGHFFGITKALALDGRFSVTTRTTSGMTSPARRTITVSPICTSLRRTSSSLCSVALVTVTPPTNTGFKRATGVIAPVRPTCTSMPTTSVAISSAGNLCATAQRGSRLTKPSFCCRSRRSTLYTTPAISNGNFAPTLAPNKPEFLRRVEPVHLVHDAVDFERELRPQRRHLFVEFGKCRGPARTAPLVIDRPCALLDRIEQSTLRGRNVESHGLADPIGEEMQWT